jgi:hypothetical protein
MMDRSSGSPRLKDIAGMVLAFGLVLATTIFVPGETPADPFAFARTLVSSPVTMAAGAQSHQTTAALR